MTIVENCEIYEDEDELKRAIKHAEPADTYVAFNEAEYDNCSYTVVHIYSGGAFTVVAELETQGEVVDTLTDLNNL
jgi:hypothetical protein